MLDKVVSIIKDKCNKMNHPFLDEDLGGIILLASFYKNDVDDKNIVNKLFKKYIEEFSKQEIIYSSFHGFEGSFFGTYYLNKYGYIDNMDILEDISEELIKSIYIDFDSEIYNIAHGCVGKLQILLLFYSIENKNDYTQLFNDCIDSLIESKKYNNKGYINWEKDFILNNDKIINEYCRILNFILKLKDIGIANTNLNILIEDLLSLLESKISFNDRKYDYIEKLNIVYSMYYASEVLNKSTSIKAKEIIDSILKDFDIKKSNILFFEEYHFYDIGISYGISGVIFLLKKIKKWYEDVDHMIKYFEVLLLDNVKKIIDIEDEIFLPKPYVNKKYYKYSFLEGLVGVGLVLSSEGDFEWGKFIGYYD